SERTAHVPLEEREAGVRRRGRPEVDTGHREALLAQDPGQIAPSRADIQDASALREGRDPIQNGVDGGAPEIRLAVLTPRMNDVQELQQFGAREPIRQVFEVHRLADMGALEPIVEQRAHEPRGVTNERWEAIVQESAY